MRLSFPATTSGLTAALAAVGQIGVDWTLDADLVSRVRIVVEELFTNTIKYGYREECKKPVRLELDAGPPLRLTYEDEAAPFDPTEWKVEPGNLETDDFPQGQAGLALVKGLTADLRYRAGPQGNRLEVIFPPKVAIG